MIDDDQIVTVEIAGVRVCYPADDFPLQYILKDPRAKVVNGGNIPTVSPDIDINSFAEGFGADPLCLMMVHLWRLGMDFCYLDIGANVGMTISTIASFMLRCGRMPKIYGFEPGAAFRTLPNTIAANGLDGCAKVYRLAMSDQEGRMTLHQINKNSSAGSLLPEIADRAHTTAMSETIVEVTSIDSFVSHNEIEGPLVIKIDTEGNDLRVVTGSAIIRAQRPVLMIMEFTPSLARAYCDPVVELIKLGQDNFILDEKIRGTPISDFAAYTSNIPEYSDIIIVPKALPGVDDLLRRLAQRP